MPNVTMGNTERLALEMKATQPLAVCMLVACMAKAATLGSMTQQYSPRLAAAWAEVIAEMTADAARLALPDMPDEQRGTLVCGLSDQLLAAAAADLAIAKARKLD